MPDAWKSDPRLSSLGHRAVLQKDETPAKSGTSSASPEDYRVFRYQQGVAEGDSEMPSGEVWRSVPVNWKMVKPGMQQLRYKHS